MVVLAILDHQFVYIRTKTEMIICWVNPRWEF